MGNDVLFNGASTAGTHVGRAPEEYQATERRAAVRAVAGNFAVDAPDCTQLLEMLGLTAVEGKQRG